MYKKLAEAFGAKSKKKSLNDCLDSDKKNLQACLSRKNLSGVYDLGAIDLVV
jgi:hypothetical protein